MRSLHSIVIGTLAALLIGCGGMDQVQIITHPDAVKPSSTFEVELMNTFIYLDSSSTITSRVERDSLHLLVGVPESWEVLEAKLSVLRDFDLSTVMAMMEDSIDEATARQLLEQMQTEVIAMNSAPSLSDAIGGMTIAAQGYDGNEDSVKTDDIDSWIGFSGPVDIVLEQGSKVDTMIALESMDELMSGLGTEESIDPAMQELLPDSLGMSAVPVVVYLKIKAGSKEGIDSLYYFTKTGDMDIAAEASDQMSLSMDLDVGSMAYYPITVSSEAAVRKSRVAVVSHDVTVTANRSTGSVTVNLGTINPNQATIGIYALTGELISTLTPATVTFWNGADKNGRYAGAGTYLIKIATADRNIVRSIQKMR